MPNDKDLIKTELLHDFLLHYKYLSSVKKITKGITHEYNNIFTGLAGQMRMRTQQSRQNSSLKTPLLIEDLLRRGIEKTELLFDFSRDLACRRKPHSPERLALRAIDLLNSVSRQHSFTLRSENDLPKIHGKHRDIVLMLFYLGENAIEAADKGGDTRIEISHLQKTMNSPFVRLQMIDSGCGFPGLGSKIRFTPIFPAKAEDTITGIGLYAVQTIVDDHGGSLTFERAPEGGTIATVDIPVLVNEQANTPDQLLRQPPHPKPLRQKHVFLVVDDEEAMREMLLSRLQRRDHVVFCAESCREAVSEFSLLADTVTVALIDVGLRDTSGYECARKLRKINENIPIVLMSGMGSELDRMVDFKASFITKPFLIEQLEQLVADAKL